MGFGGIESLVGSDDCVVFEEKNVKMSSRRSFGFWEGTVPKYTFSGQCIAPLFLSAHLRIAAIHPEMRQRCQHSR